MSDTDEQARLDTLASYQILDTAPEPGFDDIVFMAQQVCRTPIALVSLVDRERQWFKARIGIDACETPISQSVCSLGLDSADLLLFPDLTLDPRTRDNPLVTGDPHIRFYAGAPLVSSAGPIVGMLCVIDTVPRPAGLDEDQARMLRALAAQVVTLLELRKALRELGDSGLRARIAQEAANVGTFELDMTTDRLRVSPEFCRLFGISPVAEISAQVMEAIVLDQDVGVRSSMATRKDGSAAGSVEYRIRRPSDGQVRWIWRQAEFIRDDAGQLTHMVGMVQDVTDQRMLNDEVGHRLKNTLTLVQAIATHTLRPVPGRAPVEEFDRRLQALASAHDVLTSSSRPAAPLEEVAGRVFDNLGISDRVALSGPETDLNAQSTLTFSMLMHELATNALKYGALSANGGEVALDWQVEPSADPQLVLAWTERGGPAASVPTRKGLGTRLIKRGLTASGTTDLDYAPAGLTARFTGPVAELCV